MMFSLSFVAHPLAPVQQTQKTRRVTYTLLSCVVLTMLASTCDCRSFRKREIAEKAVDRARRNLMHEFDRLNLIYYFISGGSNAAPQLVQVEGNTPNNQHVVDHLSAHPTSGSRRIRIHANYNLAASGREATFPVGQGFQASISYGRPTARRQGLTNASVNNLRLQTIKLCADIRRALPGNRFMGMHIRCTADFMKPGRGRRV